MNHLALIQKALKAKAKVESYNKSVAYRGIKYEVCHPKTETHGSFCYRGRTYNR